MYLFPRLAALIITILLISGAQACCPCHDPPGTYRLNVNQDELEQLANQGHVQAQMELGTALYKGTNTVNKDQEQGQVWLRRAVASGNSDARNRFAVCLLNGNCNQTTLQEGLELLRLSALGENRDALSNIRKTLRWKNRIETSSTDKKTITLSFLLDTMKDLVDLHPTQKKHVLDGEFFPTLHKGIGGAEVMWNRLWSIEEQIQKCLKEFQDTEPGFMVSCLESPGTSVGIRPDGQNALMQDGLFSWGEKNVQLHRRVLGMRSIMEEAHELRRTLDKGYRDNYQTCMAVMIGNAIASDNPSLVGDYYQQFLVVWMPIRNRLDLLGHVSKDFETYMSETQGLRNRAFLEIFSSGILPIDRPINPMPIERDHNELYRAASIGVHYARHELAIRYLRHNPKSVEGTSYLKIGADAKYLPSMAQLFRSHVGRGKFSDALAVYGDILTWHPYSEELPGLSAISAPILADTSLSSRSEVIIMAGYLHLAQGLTDQGKREAKQRFEEAAGNSFTQAMLALARIYHHDAREKKQDFLRDSDNKVAFGYIADAAKRGLAAALNLEGVCHLTGTGTKYDPKAARDCFDKADRLGCVVAGFNLARMLSSDIYGMKDTARALIEYNCAANHFPEASLELGDLYAQPDWFWQRDLNLAAKAYSYAARVGNKEAYFKLAMVHVKKKNPLTARTYAGKAAELGHTDAMKFVADHHYAIPQVEDMIQALLWTVKGAKLGHIGLQSRLKDWFTYVTGSEGYQRQDPEHLPSFARNVMEPCRRELEDRNPLFKIEINSFVHMVFCMSPNWNNWHASAREHLATIKSLGEQLETDVWKPGFDINCIKPSNRWFSPIRTIQTVCSDLFQNAIFRAGVHIEKSKTGYLFGEDAIKTQKKLDQLSQTLDLLKKLFIDISAELYSSLRMLKGQLKYNTSIPLDTVTALQETFHTFMAQFELYDRLLSSFFSKVEHALNLNQKLRNQIFMDNNRYLAE